MKVLGRYMRSDKRKSQIKRRKSEVPGVYHVSEIIPDVMRELTKKYLEMKQSNKKLYKQDKKLKEQYIINR